MDAVLESVSEVFHIGGWVMSLLAMLSVLTVAATLERAFFWRTNASRRAHAAASSLTDLLAKGDHAGAASKAKRAPEVLGRVGSRLAAIVAETRQGGAGSTRAAQAIEDVRPSVERFGVLFGTIITAAPMLGILGTVIGIIESFRIVGVVSGDEQAAESLTNLGEVAVGIAQALYTTAVGLIVAMLALFPHALFRRSADRCLTQLEMLANASIEGSGPASASGSSADSHGDQG